MPLGYEKDSRNLSPEKRKLQCSQSFGHFCPLTPSYLLHSHSHTDTGRLALERKAFMNLNEENTHSTPRDECWLTALLHMHTERQ